MATASFTATPDLLGEHLPGEPPPGDVRNVTGLDPFPP